MARPWRELSDRVKADPVRRAQIAERTRQLEEELDLQATSADLAEGGSWEELVGKAARRPGDAFRA